MSRKGYLYSLLAALAVGFLVGFTIGGILIPERNVTAEENSPATADFPDYTESLREDSQAAVNGQTKPYGVIPALTSVETRILSAGTPWQTTLYIIRGEQPEPKMLVLGGVHGDEPAAYWSGDAASTLRVSKGTLYVVPHLNEVARSKRTREGLGDINRKFPGNPNGDTEQRLCWEITNLIREEGIKMVITFHEALGFYKEPPHHPGQTFYFDWVTNERTGVNLKGKAQWVIDEINERIKERLGEYRPEELFSTFVDPIPTSATYELMDKCGVDYAYGCEVCKNNAPERRVWFHLNALTTWMELEGFVIDNWKDVEARIWSGAFSRT